MICILIWRFLKIVLTNNFLKGSGWHYELRGFAKAEEFLPWRVVKTLMDTFAILLASQIVTIYVL